MRNLERELQGLVRVLEIRLVVVLRRQLPLLLQVMRQALPLPVTVVGVMVLHFDAEE